MSGYTVCGALPLKKSSTGAAWMKKSIGTLLKSNATPIGTRMPNAKASLGGSRPLSRKSQIRPPTPM